MRKQPAYLSHYLMKRILFLHLALVLSSCTWIFKKAGYIQDPKIETHHSMNVYAHSLGIDSSNLVFCRNLISYQTIYKMFGRSPEMLVFDGHKKHHPYKEDSSTCNAPIDVTLHNICNTSLLHIPGKNLIQYNSLIANLDDPNHCLSGFEPGSVDLIVFFNYASYFNRMNREHFIAWTNIIKTSPANCRVKYIFVNMDYLDTWGMEKRDLPKFKLRH